MTNRFLRFTALVLVPCLVTDPHLSTVCSSAGIQKITTLPLPAPFATEAIVPTSFTSQKTDPSGCPRITKLVADQARAYVPRRGFFMSLAVPFALAVSRALHAQSATRVSTDIEGKKQVLSKFVKSKEFKKYFDQGENASGFLARAKDTDAKLGGGGAFERAMQQLVQLSGLLDDDNSKTKARELLWSTFKRICPSFDAYLFFEKDPKNNKVWRYRVIVMDGTYSKIYTSPRGRKTSFYHGERLDKTDYLKGGASASVGGGIVLCFTEGLNESLKATKIIIANRTLPGIPDEIRQALRTISEKMGSDETLMADILRSTEAHEDVHSQIQQRLTRYAFNTNAFRSHVEDYHFGMLDWERLSAEDQEVTEQEAAAYLAQIATVPEDTPWVVPLELTLLADKLTKGDRAAQYVLNHLAGRPRVRWAPLGDEQASTQLLLELLKHPRPGDRARELLQRGYPGLELLPSHAVENRAFRSSGHLVRFMGRLITPLLLISTLARFSVASPIPSEPDMASSSTIGSLKASIQPPALEKNKRVLLELLASPEFKNYFDTDKDDKSKDFSLLQKAKDTDFQLGANGTFTNAMVELVRLASHLDDDANKLKARHFFVSSIMTRCPSYYSFLFFERDSDHNPLRYRAVVMDVVHRETLPVPSGEKITFVYGKRLDTSNYKKDAEAMSIPGGYILFFTDKFDKSVDALQGTLDMRKQLDEPSEIIEALSIIAEKMDRLALQLYLLRTTRRHEYIHEQIRQGLARYAFNKDTFSKNKEDYHFGIEKWGRLSLEEQEDVEQEAAAYLSQIAGIPEDKPWLAALEVSHLAGLLAKGDKAASFALNRLADRPHAKWAKPGDRENIKQLEAALVTDPRLAARAGELLKKSYPGIQLTLPAMESVPAINSNVASKVSDLINPPPTFNDNATRDKNRRLLHSAA